MGPGTSHTNPDALEASLVAPVSRREGAILALACLATAAALLWLSRYGIDPLDEGYFAHLSQRMTVGEGIYRDFPVPYTPGTFVLHAWLFQLFGVNLWVLRPLLIGVRVGLVALLYVLGRRAMPPLWAAIAPAALLLQDPVPGAWDPHPAWYALFFFLAGMWAGLRALDGRRQVWWLVAGLFAGTSFLFKQNIGLFLPMALAWLAIFDPAEGSASAAPGPWRAARLAFLGLLVGAFVYMTWPFFTWAVALAILGPLAATAVAFALGSAGRAGPPDRTLLARRGLLAASGFAAVVAPAVAWLGLAVGFEAIPFAAFAGSLDQKGFHLPQPVPEVASLLVVAELAVVTLAAARLVRAATSAIAGTTLAATSVWAMAPADSLGDPFSSLYVAVDYLFLLALPAAGAGAALLLARWPMQRQPRAPHAVLPPLLVGGVLLWFNQYPRMDAPHALWSGALLWVVGAFLLWQIFQRLLGFSQRGARGLAVALLLWPALLLYPHVFSRAQEFLLFQPAPPFVAARGVAEVGLPAAPLEAQADLAYDLRVLSWRVRDLTAEAEPIFAYPAVPIAYLLADRPNATAYAHIFPGLVSLADEQRLIAALERQQTRLLVRDRIGVEEFLPPTELTEMQAYVERHYALLEEAGRFDLLLRRAD